MTITKDAEKLAKENDFVIKAYQFEAIKEDTRKPRTVKIAAVQHAVSAPLSDPVGEQKRKTFEKVGKIIDAAAKEGVNILCLQELWYLPYFFCTREKQPWCEFAEEAETGAAVTFLSHVSNQILILKLFRSFFYLFSMQSDITWLLFRQFWNVTKSVVIMFGMLRLWFLTVEK